MTFFSYQPERFVKNNSANINIYNVPFILFNLKSMHYQWKFNI